MLVSLIATGGPLDMDDPQRVIMMRMRANIDAPRNLDARLNWKRFNRCCSFHDSTAVPKPRRRRRDLWP